MGVPESDTRRSDDRLTAIWTYPWDLLAEGLDESLGRIADTGMTAISLAVSYHAGMLLLPHNPRQKVRFLEDGAVYFRPRPDHFRGLSLQPRVSELAGPIDPLGEICLAGGRQGLEVVAWTVCCHNSYQGQQRLDVVTRNAFGDRYPFALCPSQPEVRRYLGALLRALSDYPLRAIQLESYGYMGFRHGHHHEKVLLNLGPLASYLMGLCFCPACQRAAEESDIDYAQVRRLVRRWLERAFEGQVKEPAAFSRAAAISELPGLAPYLEMRDQVVTQTVGELSRASSKPLALLGAAPKMEETATQIEEITVCLYRVSPKEVEEGARAARAQTDPSLSLTIGLDATPLLSPSEDNLAAKIQAAWDAGADGLYFYNYGLMPLRSLAWLRGALR